MCCLRSDMCYVMLCVFAAGCWQQSEEPAPVPPAVPPVVAPDAVEPPDAAPAPSTDGLDGIATTIEASATRYLPLGIAATLEYQIDYQVIVLGSGSGQATVTYRPQMLGEDTVTAETTKVSGTPWNFTRTAYYRATENGITVRESKTNDERLFLSQPLEPGTNWTMKSGDGIAECEVVAVEDVSVHGTTYTACVKVNLVSGPGSTEQRWYAPQVGLVKSVVTTPRSTTTMTLVSRTVEE